MFQKYKLQHSSSQDCCDFPLHAAIRRGEDVVIKVKPEMGSTTAIANKKDQDQNTALHLASERGYDKWVEYLIANKAEINNVNKFGMSPLMLAVRHQHPAVVLLLLSHGANVHLVNSIGQTAIHYVCCTGDQTSLKYLLQHKAKVNVQDSEGVTPLIMACRMGQAEIVKQLLAHKTVAKVNPNMKDKLGRTPLHYAAELGFTECTKALLNTNVDINAADGDNDTPFVRAIKQNRIEILDILIEAGCDRSDIDGLNGTAMTLACFLGRTEIIKRLIEAGEDVHEYGHIGSIPLVAAVFESHVDTVKLLLENGADPNKPSRNGTTCLIKTACHLMPCNAEKRHEIFKLLLRANADPNRRVTGAGFFTNITKGRNCPLSFAMSHGCMSMAKMLLIAGARMTPAEVISVMQNSNNANLEQKILMPIYEWAVQVPPLKFLSRKIIRKQLGIIDQKKLEQLPLPSIIIDYINLQELDSIKIEMTNIICSVKKEGYVPTPPCGLARLQGTLSYEVMSSEYMNA